jgi:aspartyl-tRNA(Asn)/glutamyl-tRNA(Gln) amidotransferase subunit A
MIEAIAEAKKIDSEYHYFNHITESPDVIGKGMLSGISVSVKDCIVVKGMESRAGSKILSGYKPVFDATVVERVRKEGGFIIGKTAQDEFGFGSFSTNVGIGMMVPLNPFDKERSCGGSSGGSGGITQKANFRHISLGESTGGSIVAPAAFCGVYGLCPTYGLVSRYGLMDYANSLDKIGPMAKSIEDIALMLDVIAGHDPKDSTSVEIKHKDYTTFLSKKVSDLKIGVIQESFSEGVDPEVTKIIKTKLDELEAKGCYVKEVSLPYSDRFSLATYYLIAMSEASTNLAKYCGMRYGKHEELSGNFNEYFSKVRSNNLGDEAKRRVIIGTFARMAGYRDAYYIKALKVRTRIIEEYKKAFSKYDLLISPTMPVIAPRFDEIGKMTPLQNYMMDILTVGPNLGGFPHISIPAGMSKGMPIGLMATANHFEEGKLIQIGKAL